LPYIPASSQHERALLGRSFIDIHQISISLSQLVGFHQTLSAAGQVLLLRAGVITRHREQLFNSLDIFLFIFHCSTPEFGVSQPLRVYAIFKSDLNYG
jgi:hypothetical protein